jgi:hypothetical protein
MSATPVRLSAGAAGILRDYAFAVPNGMRVAGDARKRAIYVAAMKRQGLTPGVSDIFILLARGGYHGLFLELKFGRNKLTDEQASFQRRACWAGYQTGHAHTLDQAKEIVCRYLNL